MLDRAKQRHPQHPHLCGKAENTNVLVCIASTCPTKTRELWITDCATLGRCVPARLPYREHYSPWNILRRRIDGSYRTGACRRLCIRRGGRQTDETIAQGHSLVVEKAGRNSKLRVIFTDNHLMVQLVCMPNGSLVCFCCEAETFLPSTRKLASFVRAIWCG